MGRSRQDPKTPFGWYLRHLMDANRFDSDAELAKATGLDGSLISKWQAGTARPSVENLRRVAPALKVRLVDMMVAAEIASAEELQIKGAPLKPPPARIDVSLREAADILADPGYSSLDKDDLRALIDDAVIYWRRRDRTGDRIEPSAAERAGGKPVTRG